MVVFVVELKVDLSEEFDVRLDSVSVLEGVDVF